MTIAVYFDHPSAWGYPFSDPQYFAAYAQFAERCHLFGIDLIFVRTPQSYAGNMVFRSGWKIVRGRLVRWPQMFQADLIYVKGKYLKLGPSDLSLNLPEVIHTCNDKLLSYRKFSRYSPVTLPVNADNLEKAVEQLPTEQVVLKPVFGMEGKDIIITDKEHCDCKLLQGTHQPYMAQAFVDAHEGIPGVMKGTHDLRLHVYNGEMKMAYVRQPARGKLLANIAQGGHVVPIAQEQVPDSALEVVDYVDRQLEKYYPRFYSVDVMFEGKKPYLIELNHEPGIPYPGEDRYQSIASRYQHYLLELFLEENLPARYAVAGAV